MYCPKCNVEISENAKFCHNCGCNLEQSTNGEVNINSVQISKHQSLSEFNKNLENSKEFIKYNPYDYRIDKEDAEDARFTASLWSFSLSLVIVLLLAISGFPFGAGVILFLLLWGISYGIISLMLAKPKSSQLPMQTKLSEMRTNLDEHNMQILKNRIVDIYSENGFGTISKEIILDDIRRFTYSSQTIIVDDIVKTFGYFTLHFNSYSGKCDKEEIKSCQYKDVIRYEVIDKTTSTQIASSQTSSNVGKAIGGAIVSELITGEAVSGAVIGSSGGRNTKTTYKTTKKENYDVILYLNRLNDSIITINTNDREKLSEIISVLEYILQYNATKEV